MRAPRHERGTNCNERAQGPGYQAEDDKDPILGYHHQCKMPRVITDSTKQAQLSPLFQYVSEQHGCKAQRAQDQSESPERLESRQVSVFDSMKGSKPLRSRSDLKPEVRQLLVQNMGYRGYRGYSGCLSRSHVQQKEVIPAPVGKQL